MSKKTTKGHTESSLLWENVEEMARRRIEVWLQDLLEQEVTEFLGRARSQRRSTVDATSGYRNGYGKARKLTLRNGTVRLYRPRVRDTEEKFESRLVPLFVRRTPEVSALLPELYLHGLAEGDMDLALRGLLGDEAPISASTVARLKQKWQAEHEVWAHEPLDEQEVVYLWVDGVYVKAGLEKDKAALLVVLGALSDGSKKILAVTPGHRESTQSWSSVLRDLKKRGLRAPTLVIGDGHLGIWAAIRNVYPEVEEQRCWNHRILNVLDKIPARHQAQAILMLRSIPYAETRQEAERLRRVFEVWCEKNQLEAAQKVLASDWSRMVTFYRFPKEHWPHLRTTNPVESPFAALRLRTDAAKRFKKVANATALIWRMLLVAEKRFRRIRSPHLAQDVYSGVKFVNGVRVERREAVA